MSAPTRTPHWARVCTTTSQVQSGELLVTTEVLPNGAIISISRGSSCIALMRLATRRMGQQLPGPDFAAMDRATRAVAIR